VRSPKIIAGFLCRAQAFISYTPYAVPAQQFGVHKVKILAGDGSVDVANL
jgi:hypothetical protein